MVVKKLNSETKNYTETANQLNFGTFNLKLGSGITQNGFIL